MSRLVLCLCLLSLCIIGCDGTNDDGAGGAGAEGGAAGEGGAGAEGGAAGEGGAGAEGGAGGEGGAGAEGGAGGEGGEGAQGGAAGEGGAGGGPDLCSDFLWQVCSDEEPCPQGYVCGEPNEGCTSSVCDCDPATGEPGDCTADCLMNARLCEAGEDPGPGPGDLCDGFLWQVCDERSPCPENFFCGEPREGCTASQCQCDPATGDPGACTRDCLMGARLCEPGDGPPPIGDLCDDFLWQLCDDDMVCPDGYSCGAPREGCTASRCQCDPATGDPGLCTRDCNMNARLCEPNEPPPVGDLCDDFLWQLCDDNLVCPEGYLCGEPREGCTASRCECDPATGEPGLCTRDCRNDARLCELAP